jgi:hypothetical protein
MRSIRTLLPAALLVSLVACGGGAATSADATATLDAQVSASASASIEASTEASTAASSGGSHDLDHLEDELTPPDSSETSRFDVPNGVVISYSTSASMDDLRSFYQDKLADLGLEIISTSDAGDNGVAWLFGDTAGGTFGGNVTLSPGGGSTTVVVTLGQEGS